MKKHLLWAALVAASTAFAAANDITVNQRKPDDSGFDTRTMASPVTDGLFRYNTSTVRPDFITLGTNLSITDGVLNVASSTQLQSDWTQANSALADFIKNKPSLATVATSGSYSDLSGRPTLAAVATSGAYADLSGKPSLATVATSGAYSDLSGKPPALSLTTTGTSGAATFNSGTGVLNIPNYAPGTGTVTSIIAGTGLSGGTITTSGTISLPNTGTTGTYSGVTTDAQGRVTAGTALSVNDTPGRSLVTSTSATGFQVSATRNARVCYEGSFSTTSTIGGPASASVFLETADTNSTSPSDWTTKAKQVYSNAITLAIVLNQNQGNNWSFCRDVLAGKFVRIRSGSISGTASASINTEQQESLL